MKHLAATAAVLIVLACLQSALAFSPIWNVDGWSSERLGKVGITVHPWKHDIQGEDPPLEWVQVTFDCLHLPKNQDVLMTAWVISERRTVSALRAQRGKKDNQTVTLLFAVRDNYLADSRVVIVSWRQKPGGGNAAYGYTLSVKKIIELAREKAANKPDGGDGK